MANTSVNAAHVMRLRACCSRLRPLGAQVNARQMAGTSHSSGVTIGQNCKKVIKQERAPSRWRIRRGAASLAARDTSLPRRSTGAGASGQPHVLLLLVLLGVEARAGMWDAVRVRAQAGQTARAEDMSGAICCAVPAGLPPGPRLPGPAAPYLPPQLPPPPCIGAPLHASRCLITLTVLVSTQKGGQSRRI